MLNNNISCLDNGHLGFSGVDTVAMAKKYGTPLYLFDENKIRENCRVYRRAVKKYFGTESLPLYASKAFCCKSMYRIVNDEGLGVDVVSGGELYTALSTGFPAGKIFFHGNNKTESEINYALDSKTGGFIVDNFDELYYLNKAAGERKMRQKILLRVSPGIDPHTHKAIATGSVDSKFGVPIKTGQALMFVKEALKCENLDVEGIHCHIGSQIFDSKPFTDAAKIMLDFVLEIKKETGYEAEKINLGGGIGVRYVDSDPEISLDTIFSQIKKELDIMVSERNLKSPVFLFELGRFICASAGMTLYTVGSSKTINGYKEYINIDGGMSDNPRYALYGSQYTFYKADDAKAERIKKATVAGRCCESGDVLGEDVTVPEFSRGDILAVAVTGAYNYSMASNYNRIPRPAAVMLHNGKSRIIVKRETYEDMVKNEI